MPPASPPAPTSRTPITLALGEFTSLLRSGLVQVFQADLDLKVVAADLEDHALLSAAASGAAQVVVLEASTVEGFSNALRLRIEHPAIGVLMLAHEPANAYGRAALAAGTSCLASTASADAILAAAKLTALGGRMFVDTTGDRVERQAAADNSGRLTPRELEVLRLRCQGHALAAIAAELHISLHTARSHARNVRVKIGLPRGQRSWLNLPQRTAPKEHASR